MVTPALREAVVWYQRAWPRRVDRGDSPDIVCNNLVRALGEFTGPRRAAFCTSLAAQVAALTAEALCRFGTVRPPAPAIPAPAPEES